MMNQPGGDEPSNGANSQPSSQPQQQPQQPTTEEKESTNSDILRDSQRQLMQQVTRIRKKLSAFKETLSPFASTDELKQSQRLTFAREKLHLHQQVEQLQKDAREYRSGVKKRLVEGNKSCSDEVLSHDEFRVYQLVNVVQTSYQEWLRQKELFKQELSQLQEQMQQMNETFSGDARSMAQSHPDFFREIHVKKCEVMIRVGGLGSEIAQQTILPDDSVENEQEVIQEIKVGHDQRGYGATEVAFAQADHQANKWEKKYDDDATNRAQLTKLLKDAAAELDTLEKLPEEAPQQTTTPLESPSSDAAVNGASESLHTPLENVKEFSIEHALLDTVMENANDICLTCANRTEVEEAINAEVAEFWLQPTPTMGEAEATGEDGQPLPESLEQEGAVDGVEGGDEQMATEDEEQMVYDVVEGEEEGEVDENGNVIMAKQAGPMILKD